jgi:3-deoxy-D-manno-octulosonic-acid transferase
MRVCISANLRRTRLRQPRISDEKPRGGAVTLALYRGVIDALASAVLKARTRRGKEDASRLGERRGFASRERPDGTLIWIHGASVGESLAVLPLVSKLLERPDRHVLVTTGTVTSARLMTERLPQRAFHQYVPIDTRSAVRRFLAHWRPNLALFVESEFWPNLILETRALSIPMALVNARFTQKSYEGWRRAPNLARRIVSSFDATLAQDGPIVNRLIAFGAKRVQIAGSLKADAPPLPVDQAALDSFRDSAGTRRIFLAASTHPGEDAFVLEAARNLRLTYPDLLTVIVPRHPQRGAEIEALAVARGFTTARRSAGALPSSTTQVYVADTLGELGLFYRAAPFAFLGGSLVSHGGQNPLEPSRLGIPIIAGPHTGNFEEIFRVLLEAQGEGRVESESELAALANKWLADTALAVQTAAALKPPPKPWAALSP